MMEMSLWVSRAGGKSHVHLGVCHSEKSSAFPVSVFVCMCVCVCVHVSVCTQIVLALFRLLYADIARSSRNLCNLMVANTEEKPREIPLHHLKLLPTHTYIYLYAHKSHRD